MHSVSESDPKNKNTVLNYFFKFIYSSQTNSADKHVQQPTIYQERRERYTKPTASSAMGTNNLPLQSKFYQGRFYS